MSETGWVKLAVGVLSSLPGIVFEGTNIYGKEGKFENFNTYERIAADVGLPVLVLLSVVVITVKNWCYERNQAHMYPDMSFARSNFNSWYNCFSRRNHYAPLPLQAERVEGNQKNKWFKQAGDM